MALSKSITALIADGQGRIAKDFLDTTPEGWAQEHMQRRYNAAPPALTDPPGHIAQVCYTHLIKEWNAVRQWFDSEGTLSPLLMSQHLSRLSSGPLGSGMGWDFLPNGDPEPRMLQFKGMLIACQRMAELKPESSIKLDNGSREMGGVAKLVRSAYAARAEIHNWQAQDLGDGSILEGGEICRRWIAYRTFIFLLRIGAEEDWAWDLSQCNRCFGVNDNSRRAQRAG